MPAASSVLITIATVSQVSLVTVAGLTATVVAAAAVPIPKVNKVTVHISTANIVLFILFMLITPCS